MPIHLDCEEVAKAFLERIEYVLIDCDGVLFLSNQAIDGAPETVNALRSKGKKVIFASNNSTKSRATVLSKLNLLGFNATLEEVVVSSYVVAVYLKQHKFEGNIYVFGCQGIEDELSNMGFTCSGVGHEPFPADNVKDNLIPPVELREDIGAVIVGYDNLISLPKLIKVCTYASKVPDHLFIATNIDETFPTYRSDLLVPGTGCFVAFVETAVGKKPVVMGKPGTLYFDCVKSLHPNLDLTRTCMIGDRLNTDIAFGNQNGILMTLFVETGINSLQDVENAANSGNPEDKLLIPSHYIKSLGDLYKYLH